MSLAEIEWPSLEASFAFHGGGGHFGRGHFGGAHFAGGFGHFGGARFGHGFGRFGGARFAAAGTGWHGGWHGGGWRGRGWNGGWNGGWWPGAVAAGVLASDALWPSWYDNYDYWPDSYGVEVVAPGPACTPYAGW